MTRIVWLWLVASLISSAGCSSAALAFAKKRPELPERDVCILGDSGCLCYDPRTDKETVRPYLADPESCLNYHAYSPDDYDALQEWISRNCWGPR